MLKKKSRSFALKVQLRTDTFDKNVNKKQHSYHFQRSFHKGYFCTFRQEVFERKFHRRFYKILFIPSQVKIVREKACQKFKLM